MKTEADRFWAKVNKTETCWLWTGSTNGQTGHGQFHAGKKVRAHRWAYEQEHGPIPVGLEPDHLCREPRCVRPAHLEPVTHRENLRRGNGFAGQKARQTHCLRGHAFDEANTYVTKLSQRRCRACRRKETTK